MKKIILTLFFIASLLSVNTYADNIKVNINGKAISFSDVNPQIINGRTMVPVRTIFEALGASVNWNNSTKEITGKTNDTTVIMKLNSTNVNVNGFTRIMDCAPSVINGRTLTPAKYVAEILGYNVNWDNSSRTVTITKGNFVFVHFIDVGQGDCTFIKDNGHSMVIDAGEEGNENTVINYIKNQGINNIDYVVASHPHSDHIGSLDGVIDSFTIQNILMPNVVNNSKCFENLLNSIEKSKANVIETKPDNTYNLGKSKFTVAGPVKYDNDNQNNNSAVIKLTYGNNSVLLTGDAENEEENDILASKIDISADILKVGHHGSSTSTSTRFLNMVNPNTAIICVGKDNKYGHPTEKTLNTLKDKTIYRTDLNGNIMVTMTGNDTFVSTSKTSNNNISTNTINISETYILNTNTHKVHLPNCMHAKNMSDKNKQVYTGSPKDLKSKGYTACQNCKPF